MGIKLISAFAAVVAMLGMVGILQTATVSAGPGNPNPQGNNGTIKVGGVDIDNGNANDPHIDGCSMQVQFYGYDEGARTATITFESQAPTPNTLTSPVGPQVFNFTGGGIGNTLNGTAQYVLSFNGSPQPNQGYHVKVTVHADGSKGNDTKSKVFWIEGCESKNETSPNISAALVCDEKTSIFTLTVTNSGTAAGSVVLNGGSPTNVPAGGNVPFTIKDNGSGVTISLTSDGKTIGEFNGRLFFCKQGQGSIGGGTVATLGGGSAGQGAATGVASLPYTAGDPTGYASIVAGIVSALGIVGSLVIRLRSAASL